MLTIELVPQLGNFEIILVILDNEFFPFLLKRVWANNITGIGISIYMVTLFIFANKWGRRRRIYLTQ